MSLLIQNHTLLSSSTLEPMVLTIRTTTANESVSMPSVTGYTYLGAVDWGVGAGTVPFSGYNHANLTNTFSTAGDYQVKIYGEFGAIYVNNTHSSRLKIIKVEKIGNVKLKTLNLYGCANLTQIPNDGAINGGKLILLDNCFRNCTGITNWGDISSWDT